MPRDKKKKKLFILQQLVISKTLAYSIVGVKRMSVETRDGEGAKKCQVDAVSPAQPQILDRTVLSTYSTCTRLGFMTRKEKRERKKVQTTFTFVKTQVRPCLYVGWRSD